MMNDNSVYIIAEFSANHNGSLERAKESIRAAAECGADANKIQTCTADTLTGFTLRQRFLYSGTVRIHLFPL